jgi:hypothetical protein
MTYRRGVHDKHVTVPDAVQVGVSSHIATIPVTDSQCTGDNSSKFIFREGKNLLSCIEAHCERANRRLVRFDKYRQIFNYEINLEF